MKNVPTLSPKATWLLAKRIFVSTAIIPTLAFSSFTMALTPVAYAAETCDVITLVSGEDTQTAGYTITDPVTAPASLVPALYSDVTFSDASITNAVIPPWVDPAVEADLTNAEWISTSESNNEGTATDNQWRLFEDTFTLPAGAVVGSADLWYTADNAAAVYLNGSDLDNTGDVYGTAPDPGTSNFEEVYDTSFDPVDGINTLNFVVRNWAAQGDSNPGGFIYRAVVEYCVETDETPETATVTIVKYIGEDMATAITANNADFPMTTTYNAENIGAGTGEYALSETGFNGDPTPYQAITSQMTKGADYNTNEILTGEVVGASCADNKPFALAGYTTGTTIEEAEAGELSLVTPTFTNLQDDQYVIVWNTDCSEPVPPVTSVKVMISKFVQGALATGVSADGASFPMSATWDAENIGTGTGEYTLDASGETPYQTMTVAMTPGADYSTNEILTGNVVSGACIDGKPFALAGYSTGDTYAQAVAADSSMTIPAFTNLQADKYVIVRNLDCSMAEGGIGGDVEPTNGALAVTSIDSVDTSAIANGSFGDGWRYVFHITAPTNEQNLAMKFSNWDRTGGGGTILTANNMRISSAQADNGGATILVTAPNTYTIPALHMTSDLNAVMDGRQVEVSVEVAVPVGTPSGSYTTSYGVQTNP